jgi:tetraacyldisaccharide 4'-kinase
MRRPWLAPLVPLYAAGAALRARMQPVRRLGWPVISIGNLSTGGAGKTPLAIVLAQLLAARGVQVDVLSRGYGRTSREPARVRPDGNAAEFGDEPLLIARAAGVPVYVASQRYDAGLLAEADAAGQDKDSASRSARAHILDDGFQHRQLERDVDILLLDRTDWSDALLPAGNLREPLRAARRANVIAIPADDAALESELRAWGWSGPVWRLHRRMQVPPTSGTAVAFCGIARPEQFFTGLESADVRLQGSTPFRDHHTYAARDIERLIASARSAGASAFITTEKDAVRLGALSALFPADLPLHTAKLTMRIEDETAVIDWLLTRLNAVAPS